MKRHFGDVTSSPNPIVILNLFQDNMRPWFVILKQVQDDERVALFKMTKELHCSG